MSKVGEEQRYISGVYSWMFLGLIVTSITLWASAHMWITRYYYRGHNPMTPILLILGVVLCVGLLAGAVKYMNMQLAVFTFFAYAGILGVVVNIIFNYWYNPFLFKGFLAVAVQYGITSILLKGFGDRYTFKSGYMVLAGVGTVSMLVAMNMFRAGVPAFILVVLFTLLTGVEMSQVLKYNKFGNEGTEENQKECAQGALELYLSFVGIFVDLIRQLAVRRKL